jgi:hypothetical protein
LKFLTTATTSLSALVSGPFPSQIRTPSGCRLRQTLYEGLVDHWSRTPRMALVEVSACDQPDAQVVKNSVIAFADVREKR